MPLYRAAQKWPRLLATYEALLGPNAANEGVPMAERLDLFTEARLICEQRLGSKALAFQWCARAFEAAPKNDNVRTELERLAGEADEWSALAALYEARTVATTDAEERLWLLRRVLRIASTAFQASHPHAPNRSWRGRLRRGGRRRLEQIYHTMSFCTRALLHRAHRAPYVAERVLVLLKCAARVQGSDLGALPPRSSG